MAAITTNDVRTVLVFSKDEWNTLQSYLTHSETTPPPESMINAGIIGENGEVSAQAQTPLLGVRDATQKMSVLKIRPTGRFYAEAWLSNDQVSIAKHAEDTVRIYAIDREEAPIVLLDALDLRPRPAIDQGPHELPPALLEALFTGDVELMRTVLHGWLASLEPREGQEDADPTPLMASIHFDQWTCTMTSVDIFEGGEWFTEDIFVTLSIAQCLYVIQPASADQAGSPIVQPWQEAGEQTSMLTLTPESSAAVWAHLSQWMFASNPTAT